MLFERFSNPDGSPPGFFLKAGMGMAAGASGAFVGTPAEVKRKEITVSSHFNLSNER